jgi:hypothetical protein
MHRHGTLKGRWKALAFGALWVLLGYLLARPAWQAVFAQAVPQPPGAWEAMSIFGGGLLIVIGLVLGLTPHFLWLLRTFYKEDFAPEARCPVMVVCPACREYNNRTRRHCAACSTSLLGARSAGGGEKMSPGPDEGGVLQG